MALIPKPETTVRWAEGGNQLEPASEVQELGFVVEKPPYEVVNWLHNKHDTAIAYLFQEGFADWDIEREYSNTSYVEYAGTIYQSKLQNIGKQPDINPDNWEVAFANYQDYLDLYQDLQNTKNVAGHADNLVYKDTPVMTDKAVGTSFSANSGIGTNDGFQFNGNSRDGLFHNGSNPVVLNDGATVASFSGNTTTPSDKDVVTFDMLKKYLELYKVGDLYITTNSANPSTTLGYGTWQKYGKGRALVGHSDDVTTNTPDWVKLVGTEYGTYEHKLTVEEMPSHEHKVGQLGYRYSFPESYDVVGNSDGISTDGIIDQLAYRGTTQTGGGQSHNNVQPSIVVFIWRRVL